MKIDVEFAGLDRVLEKMGVEELIEGPGGDEWDPIDIELVGRGVDVNLEEIVVDPGNGTFSYKGRKVLVYIRDQNVSYDRGYKFHVADCSTIHDMKKRKRFESRYVASTRTDGKFIVNLVESGEIIEKAKLLEMSICKNCLKHLNFQNYDDVNYSEKCEIYRNFSLEEFFAIYGETKGSKPLHSDITAPTNEYSSNWDIVSRIYRESVNWKCENCRIDLKANEAQKFLHTHHINGDKTNNHPTNLRALCVDCHNQEEGHSLPDADRRALQEYKRRLWEPRRYRWRG